MLIPDRVVTCRQAQHPQEVEGMAELKAGIGVEETPNKPAPGSGWRHVLLTTGFFCMLVALFIGAAMKEAGSGVPRFFAIGGLSLITISAVGSLINWISLKGSRTAQPIK
jgi:hypothetical protein